MSNLSITRADAKKYIARPVGGAGLLDSLAMAEEAILRGFADWQDRDWEFLLRDNTSTFAVNNCILNSGNPVVTAPSASVFDGINAGITVIGTNIPANTTVLSFTRNADRSIASITLSANPTGSTTTTLTFGGLIPVVAGQTDYNLPTDFGKHYGVRFVSALKWPLDFIRFRDWNKVTLDQTIQGTPEAYTIFNISSALSQNKGTFQLRILRVPQKSDSIRVDYYRRFDEMADPLDMYGPYLYKFLDYCRGLLITTRRGFDDPALALSDSNRALAKAKEDDENVTEDEIVHMKSQMEMWPQYRLTWNNGPFYPDYGGW